MRSRAQIKAHPIHPSLIPFPFAFLWGALLFDAAGILWSSPQLSITAGHLTIAGVAAGLIAAVPGVIDYIYAVPPDSSGKKRATRHGLGNVTALALFTAAWFTRSGEYASGLTLGLELLGAAVLSYAGLLGGTLVIRNMVSVDHRYADTGKWNEQSVEARKGESVIVADAGELKEDQLKLLRVNGRRIALARTADGYCAFDDSCTHRGGSLADGVLIDGTVQCLWHGSQFDVATGKVRCGPAEKGVRVYKVEEKRGKVWLTAPE